MSASANTTPKKGSCKQDTFTIATGATEQLSPIKQNQAETKIKKLQCNKKQTKTVAFGKMVKPQPKILAKQTQSTKGESSSSLNSLPTVNSTKFRLSAQRQGTFTSLSYRFRKSISQLDMKQARRSGLMSPHKLTYRLDAIEANSDADQTMVPEQSCGQNNGYYHSMAEINDPQLAGFRVYTAIMLNAWRKRRDEVKLLNTTIQSLKKDHVKAKNQLHVFNTLFHVEQKRNSDLTEQLRIAQEYITDLSASKVQLGASLEKSETNRANLEHQLAIKTQDHVALNTFFKQTKSELFKIMSDQQETLAKLETEQARVQQLESEKTQLLDEVQYMCTELRIEEEKLREALQAKEAKLACVQAEAKYLEAESNNMKENLCAQIHLLSTNETKLKIELEAVHSEVKLLRRCLAATLGRRLKNCWNNTVMVQRATCQMVHWFTASLLPATPPPKNMSPLLVNFSLEKAMNIVKRTGTGNQSN